MRCDSSSRMGNTIEDTGCAAGHETLKVTSILKLAETGSRVWLT